jgi:hypothetical protein
MLAGGSDCIRFPTYTNRDGFLRIDGGIVSVATSITTYSHFIYIASNSTNTNSYLGIDGPTITDDRYIACYQNKVSKCIFGLRGTSEYFIRDTINNKDIFQAKLNNSIQCIYFPTYTVLSTVSIGANGLVTGTSDRRLKQNEEALIPADSLQQILDLQPKTYVWKDDKDRTRIGFIAQDVETVIPDAVDGKKFEYEFVRDGASQDSDGTVRIDEEGNPVLDYNRPRYRGLDQCAIIAVLVSAVQELTNRVIELESKFGETPQE